MIDTLLAMDPSLIAAFITAGVLLNLTPGADVLFATASGLSGGWRSGVAAGLGIAFGGLVHVVLAAFGVAALVAANPLALVVLKYLGAGYLAWLAWHAWNAAPSPAQTGAPSLRHALVKGFLTNLLNPKVILFVLAFLPQFVTPGAGPVWQQILGLGLIFVATGTLITCSYGALAGVLGQHLTPKLSILNRITALIFGGLAVRIVID